LVDGDNYLLALSRYVHLNPVKVALFKLQTTEEKVSFLRKYRWSSYPGFIDVSRRRDFVEYSPVSSMMGGNDKEWPALYMQYVESGLAVTDREFLEAYRRSPRCIGGRDFVSHVDDLYREISESYTSQEDVTFRRILEPVDPESVLSVVAEVFAIEKRGFLRQRRNCPLRGIAAGLLLKYSGLTQRQIANLLNLSSGSTISKQIRRSRNLIEENRELSSQVEQCKKILEEMRVIDQLRNN
jgi:hypothetical protein